MTKDFHDWIITFTVALIGDLSKNFSRLEVQCPCGCGTSLINPFLVEKLQKVRNIIGRPIIITSGVRCEFYNISIKEHSLVVEEIQASSWSLRNLNATQKELKRYMVLHYQESLNDKAWQRYLIRRLKHDSQFYLNGRWNFKWWKRRGEFKVVILFCWILHNHK